MKKADDARFRQGLENMQNPYGDGKTSDKIIRIIETKLFNTEVDLKKTFYDIE